MKAGGEFAGDGTGSWTRWGAYGASAFTGAYGIMKLAQALGANALADKDPLRPDLRARLLARDPVFVASHWVLFALAAVGVVLALSTVRPWGWRVPRRPLLVLAAGLGALMVLRSCAPVGFGLIGDVRVLTGLAPPPSRYAELSRMLARWDLFLWSPYFLVWGLLWLTTALHLRRTSPRRRAT